MHLSDVPLVEPRASLTKICFALLALTASAASPALHAETDAWQPSAGHEQIAIWPSTPPDAQPNPAPERVITENKSLIAGRPFLSVENVSRPTITVYSPRGANTGIAVLILPGGGYQDLAIDLEGTEVCDWLNAHGMTGVLLKYRIPHSGPYWDPKLKREVDPVAPMALEDTQRALGLVRAHATEYGIDPHKIGVLGFSAGGHLSAAIATHFDKRLYKAIDHVDAVSCRPNFAVSIYPGHLWGWTPQENPNFDLNPDIATHITAQTPPTFLVQAENDNVDSVNDSLVYYIALKKAKVPVEMHLYADGHHAFGLRHTDLPITDWPSTMEVWLRTIGMIAK
jgi:acetyl esterase/lipase